MSIGEENLNLYLIAGPNGAGKTTFAREFLPRYARCNQFVNADLIAGGLSPFAPEVVAIKAGRVLLEEIRAMAKKRCDFAFETTLSGRTYLKFFKKLKGENYSIHLFYLWVCDLNLAYQRITSRVRAGGHDVPREVVRRRFDKGLANFFRFYEPLFDSWIFLDNSGLTPRLIASKRKGKIETMDHELFARIRLGVT